MTTRLFADSFHIRNGAFSQLAPNEFKTLASLDTNLEMPGIDSGFLPEIRSKGNTFCENCTIIVIGIFLGAKIGGKSSVWKFLDEF